MSQECTCKIVPVRRAERINPQQWYRIEKCSYCLGLAAEVERLKKALARHETVVNRAIVLTEENERLKKTLAVISTWPPSYPAKVNIHRLRNMAAAAIRGTVPDFAEVYARLERLEKLNAQMLEALKRVGRRFVESRRSSNAPS